RLPAGGGEEAAVGGEGHRRGFGAVAAESAPHLPRERVPETDEVFVRSGWLPNAVCRRQRLAVRGKGQATRGVTALAGHGQRHASPQVPKMHVPADGRQQPAVWRKVHAVAPVAVDGKLPGRAPLKVPQVNIPSSPRQLLAVGSESKPVRIRILNGSDRA